MALLPPLPGWRHPPGSPAWWLPPAGHMSYPEVVRTLCGRTGSLLLELSLIFRCAGLMIVYCVGERT